MLPQPQPIRAVRVTRFIELFRTTPPRTVCPNFFVLAHANGCGFLPGCAYCYLKSSFWYLRRPRVYTNTDRIIEEAIRWIGRDGLESPVLNTGNLSDSLVFEPVRPLMAALIETFRAHARGRPHTLLLVTKGGRDACEPLLRTEPCTNVVVSFSVTAPSAARRYEAGAPPVKERLAAAEALRANGWRVRIRIDPMITGFDHRAVGDPVAALGPERVTLGTLRAEPNLLRVVRNGVFADLIPPEDPRGLARYPKDARISLYEAVAETLRSVCTVALCEEDEATWRALALDVEARRCNCAP